MKFSACLLTGLLLASSYNTIAQVSKGGVPADWNNTERSFSSVNVVEMPQINLDRLEEEDAVTDQYKETPYRFGVEHSVDINVIAEASVENRNGMEIYRLGLYCPDATSISLIFSTLNIPKGDMVYLYNEDRTEFLGGFDHSSENTLGGLGTSLIHTDLMVIEYQKKGTGTANLHLGTVVHGYRTILNKWEDTERGPYGSSGACNINVNCSEGDAWQAEKRSVALIISGGFAQCTGALVNNTAQDGTPYFLTANHCLNSGVNNWVFIFNHETAGCSGSNGPTSDSVSGAVTRANNGGSDFALLELDDIPPASYNVQYVGWDRTDNETVSSAVGIHHPSGDVKKICFENDDPYHDFAAGAQVWFIDEWEDGVTEGGSSGSPLFDQNHRVIGQLYGGIAACSGSVNNGQFDYYGRFGVSWDGSSASNRLRDWLDPLNINPQILDGWPEGAETYALDATVAIGNEIPQTICGNQFTPEVSIINQGTSALTSATVVYTINGNSNEYSWSGNLAQFASEEVTLPPVNLQNGNNQLIISVTEPNGSVDENDFNDISSVEFNAVTGETANYQLDLLLDNYGEETTWEVTQGNNTLFNGGPYDLDGGTNIIVDFCLTEGCYEFTIFDDYDDGICCDFGEGSYALINDEGNSFAQGGEFTSTDNVDFCVNLTNSVDEQNELSSIIYPNPNAGQFTIEFANATEVLSIDILDATGRMVKSIQTNSMPGNVTGTSGSGHSNGFGINEGMGSGMVQISLGNGVLNGGIYFVRISGNGNWKTHRMIVK